MSLFNQVAQNGEDCSSKSNAPEDIHDILQCLSLSQIYMLYLPICSAIQ